MAWSASLIFSQPSLLFSQGAWKLVKEKNGVSIFINPAGNSKYPPLKGIMILPYPIEDVLKTLRDYSAYPSWQPFMNRFEPLTPIGNDQAIFYALFDFPWPILNRDLVLKNTIEEISASPMTLKIHLEDTDFPLPTKGKKYVHIAYYRSDIIIEKIETSQTRLTATLEAHPGGQLPVLGVNWVMREAVYRALVNLRGMIGKASR